MDWIRDMKLTQSELDLLRKVRLIRESGGLDSNRPEEVKEVRDAAQYAASNED